MELTLYLRAKIGFCNCTTGVADDEELERLSDFDLMGTHIANLGGGRPITVAWMKGRSRSYAFSGAARGGKSALSIAFNDRCDAIVATVVVGHDRAELIEPGALDFESLAEIAEAAASCEIYGLLKRPDEKYVTERAYDNPKFVEDIIRDVAGRLNREGRLARPPAELLGLLRRAQAISARSGGSFDVTVQPLWLLCDRCRQQGRSDDAPVDGVEVRFDHRRAFSNRSMVSSNRLNRSCARSLPPTV